MKPLKHYRAHLLWITALLWPLTSMADRYGIQEAMENGPGNSDGLKFLLMGTIVGAGIGYAYSCYYNNSQSKKMQQMDA